jgi:hypothetical protein
VTRGEKTRSNQCSFKGRQEGALTAVPTEVNVVLTFLARLRMAVIQTTMTKASMTAYSTAVGPFSLLRKFTMGRVSVGMNLLLERE